MPGMSDEPRRPWQCIGSRLIWQSRWYDLRQDAVRIHTGQTITYTYQDHPGAVLVVPVTASRQVVLVRQYRYLLDAWSWEAPAGGLHPGETVAEAAARELAEEAGYLADRIEPLGDYFPSKSVSNEQLHLLLAHDVRPSPADAALDATELLSVHLLDLDAAVAMVHQGAITDMQTALALLLTERLLRDGGPSF
jgi:ADP-ribose pyrophosphatase